MKTEIEAKFLQVDVEAIRASLRSAGAKLETPMRLMRRAIMDYPDKRLQENNGYVRVRDEGDKITLTFKQFEALAIDGAKELETVVGSFDDTVAILRKLGLEVGSLQESKRETWRLGNVEVVIDEWPWLRPYIEIEGFDEAALRSVADRLGRSWDDAVFGDVMAAYRYDYPRLSKDETVGNLSEVRFDMPLPELFIAAK